MLHLYHLFKPKTRKSSLDEITLLAIDCWNNFRNIQYYNGIPLYINKDGSECHLQYGTVRMTITKSMNWNSKSVNVLGSVFIGYDDLQKPNLRNYETILKIDLRSDKVLLFENKNNNTYRSSMDFDIEVPFDMMNEIDFFQYETLNPVLPISRAVLVKLVQTIIKDIT